MDGYTNFQLALDKQRDLLTKAEQDRLVTAALAARTRHPAQPLQRVWAALRSAWPTPAEAHSPALRPLERPAR
jgi:hypothetical protein